MLLLQLQSIRNLTINFPLPTSFVFLYDFLDSGNSEIKVLASGEGFRAACSLDRWWKDKRRSRHCVPTWQKSRRGWMRSSNSFYSSINVFLNTSHQGLPPSTDVVGVKFPVHEFWVHTQTTALLARYPGLSPGSGSWHLPCLMPCFVTSFSFYNIWSVSVSIFLLNMIVILCDSLLIQFLRIHRNSFSSHHDWSGSPYLLSHLPWL